MFSKYFISTLVFIIVSLVVLFQGEIKEGFVQMSPMVYGSPNSGTVPKPFFSGWQGNGAQFMNVEAGPYFDKYGSAIAPIRRELGYDTLAYKSPASKSSPVIGHKAMPNKINRLSGTKEGYTSVNTFKEVQIEAGRNMQPMTGGPPRFNNNQSPHFNLTYPVDNARYAVDPAHPIVNYGCDDIYADNGQAQKLDIPIRENYGEAQLPQNMMSLGGQPAQPIVIDRVGMPALAVNSKSRLLMGADFIRGDIEIVPSLYMSDDGCGGFKGTEYPKWFQVSVKPSRDLRAGYLRQDVLRGAEGTVNAAASGIPNSLFFDKTDNLNSAKSIVNYNSPDTRMSSMATFGTDSSVGRSNSSGVRYGTDIGVGSYGL